VTGVDKWFGSTHALRSVDLEIEAGQCLGLVGRNGAGKSTLVSVLSGLVSPDAGEVRFDGALAPRVGEVAGWREWIATVFQHSMVVPDLSVAENVFLGSTGRLVGWLDEPTAALERDAVRRLFDRVRQLVAGGVAVLYISHHLEEVFEICQDVAVLRDGQLVLTAPVADLRREGLVAAMVGAAPVTEPGGRRPARAAADRGAEPVLTVADLHAASPRGRLSGVSLRIAPGEVVGVTGLLSAGVATLGRVIAGAEPYSSGQVRVRGAVVPGGRRDAAQGAGIGYIPEDRRAEGFVAHLGVAENVTMTIAGRLADRLGLTRPGRRAAAAAPITSALSLVSSGPAQPVGELSGGNQQKATVARTLAHDPDVVVAITPTRGVDVASKALLLRALADVAHGTGAGVLLCSDELSDLGLCDRIVVLVRGEVFTEFTEPPFDRDALIIATEGLDDAAAGGTKEAAP
jgi:simple sugar transport system ATP-binding protein